MFCGGFGRGFVGGTGIYGFMSVMMLFRFLVFIGIIVLAVKLFKRHTDSSRMAIKTLDERFARGEISEEEYINRKNLLSQRN